MDPLIPSVTPRGGVGGTNTFFFLHFTVCQSLRFFCFFFVSFANFSGFFFPLRIFSYLDITRFGQITRFGLILGGARVGDGGLDLGKAPPPPGAPPSGSVAPPAARRGAGAGGATAGAPHPEPLRCVPPSPPRTPSLRPWPPFFFKGFRLNPPTDNPGVIGSCLVRSRGGGL